MMVSPRIQVHLPIFANNAIDEETFADKKAWADGYCFGGTMIWSIDFQASGGSGSGGGNVPSLPAELPGIPKSLKGKRLSECVGGQLYDNIKDKAKFWYDSGAEQWVDEYINSKDDHTLWARDLYLALFPKADQTSFLCNEPGAQCNHGKECSKSFLFPSTGPLTNALHR
jgi:hypothetical protein